MSFLTSPLLWSVVLLLSVAALGVLVYALAVSRALRRANDHLYRGDPDAFMAELDRQRWWMSLGRYRAVLRLNEAAGLFWQGRFSQAVEVLDSVAPERLRPLTRAAYDSCLISSLIMDSRLTEAARLYEQRQQPLRDSGHQLAPMICASIEADLAFFGGELAKAKQLCEQVLEEHPLPRIAKATLHWQLAEVAFKQHDAEQTAVHLTAALAGSGRTFVTERVLALQAALDDAAVSSSADPADDDEPDSLEPVAVTLAQVTDGDDDEQPS